MRRKALKQKKIWNPALFEIRNPLSWNPESSTRNPESTGWNPESRTVMDSLTWGEMLNYSFSIGTFPQRWKPAKVTPLFKEGDTSNPSNYRPIYVLTVISIKNYWTLRRRFFVWLEIMGGCLIYLDSLVFVSTMVLRLRCLKMKVDELLLNLDNNRVSGVLLVDYCKAFDMVDQNLLLAEIRGLWLYQQSI